MHQPCNIFFLGKGGVGKSTSSALTAISAAEAGKKVLLVSLDPAHNQSDIFDTKLSDKPKKINKQLSVSELDLNKWVRSYLKGVEEQVKGTYKYLTALNLEHYFKVIKYSPGIEEYALLMAYEHLTQKYRDMDYIVFDMPPTALTLRFFELPKTSLIWLNQLLSLRNEILKKREIISTIKVGKKKIQSDKIITRLDIQIARYEAIRQTFSDPKRTYLHLVLNPDKMSLSESMLIVRRLQEYELTIQTVFLNKYQQEDISELKGKLPKTPIVKIPRSHSALLGMEMLQNFLTHNNIRIPLP